MALQCPKTWSRALCFSFIVTLSIDAEPSASHTVCIFECAGSGWSAVDHAIFQCVGITKNIFVRDLSVNKECRFGSIDCLHNHIGSLELFGNNDAFVLRGQHTRSAYWRYRRMRQRSGQWIFSDDGPSPHFDLIGWSLARVLDMKLGLKRPVFGELYKRFRDTQVGSQLSLGGVVHQVSLPLYGSQRAFHNRGLLTKNGDLKGNANYLQDSGSGDGECKVERPSIDELFLIFFSLFFGGLFLSFCGLLYINDKRAAWRTPLIVVGLGCVVFSFLFLLATRIHPYTWGLPTHRQFKNCDENGEYRQGFQHGETLPDGGWRV